MDKAASSAIAVLCAAAMLTVVFVALRTHHRPRVTEIGPDTSRSLRSVLDAVLPPALNPTTNLWSYYRAELIVWHYYSTMWVGKKNHERHSDIRATIELATNVISVLAVSLVLARFLYDPKLRFNDCADLSEGECGDSSIVLFRTCSWERANKACASQPFDAPQVLLLACLINILVCPLTGLGGWLASCLEDLLAALQLQSLYVASVGDHGECKEEDLEEMGAETWQVQTRRATLLRAARVAMLRRDYDFCTADQEAALVMQCAVRHAAFPWHQAPEAFSTPGGHLRNALRFAYKSLQHRAYFPADPRACAAFLQHHHLLGCSRTAQRLRFVRQQTQALRQTFAAFGPSRAERGSADRLLLALFLVYWFAGCTQQALAAALLEDADARTLQTLHLARRRRVHIPRMLLAAVAVGAVLVAALVALLAYYPPQSHMASRVLVAAAAAHALHAFMLLPLRVALQQLLSCSFARAEFTRLHRTVRARSRFVLGRDHGVVSPPHDDDLLQHFHPACRLARLLPALATARLLSTFRDHDLLAANLAPPPPRRLRLTSPWESGSPLVSDCLAVLVHDLAMVVGLVGHRLDLLLSRCARLALHGVLALPVSWRGGAWDLVAVLCVATCVLTVTKYPAVAALWALAGWSFTARCFALRGPAQLLRDLVAHLHRSMNNAFVREKQRSRSRKHKRVSVL